MSNAATQYEVSELPSLGWLRFESMGDENLYFVLSDGSRGFVKLG